MRTISVVLTPQEIAAYEASALRQIVRVAVECPECDGDGESFTRNESGHKHCYGCHGTGYLPNPLGDPGDVLVFTYEYTRPFIGGGDMTYKAEARYTRVGDARLELRHVMTYVLAPAVDDWGSTRDEWVWVAGVERQGGHKK